MNRLFTLTALIETATGLALMSMPSAVVQLLFGAEISGASILLSRVAGCSLLSLGIACWPPRDPSNKMVSSLAAMLTYNLLVTLYLLYVGISGEWVGRLLWPAVALHGILSLVLVSRWRQGHLRP